AAELVGMDSVPSIRLKGLSADQKKALRIADNQLALNAGWDLELLASEIESLATADFDIDLLGFDSKFLDALFEEEPEEDEFCVDDDEDGVPGDYVSEYGDVMLLGSYRVMCCTRSSVVD